MNWLVEPPDAEQNAAVCGLAFVIIGGCLGTVLCKNLCAVDCDLCLVYIYNDPT